MSFLDRFFKNRRATRLPGGYVEYPKGWNRSLYEQDTTGIKGGDFERFGAFADNHLDFIRALTKARGMDPISSDREIAAFLNTFDKLAAMPEPSPASQEKDELSAGVCDPTDPTMGCLQPDSPAAIR